MSSETVDAIKILNRVGHLVKMARLTAQETTELFTGVLQRKPEQLDLDELNYFGLALPLFYFKLYRKSSDTRLILREVIFETLVNSGASGRLTEQETLLRFSQRFKEYNAFLTSHESSSLGDAHVAQLCQALAVHVTGGRVKGELSFMLPNLTTPVSDLMAKTKSVVLDTETVPA